MKLLLTLNMYVSDVKYRKKEKEYRYTHHALGSHKDWKQGKTACLAPAKGNERKLYFVCFRQARTKGHVLDYYSAGTSAAWSLQRLLAKM